MPDPLVEIAIEAKLRSDRDKLLHSLAHLASEDAALRVTTDAESGQTIIGGMSEEHVATAVDRVKCEFGIDLAVGAPQVAYRETITRAADVDYNP